MTTTEQRIELLLAMKRVCNCTQSDNVSLCNAVDHITIGNHRDEKALARLEKAIREDMEWSPWRYSARDQALLKLD